MAAEAAQALANLRLRGVARPSAEGVGAAAAAPGSDSPTPATRFQLFKAMMGQAVRAVMYMFVMMQPQAADAAEAEPGGAQEACSKALGFNESSTPKDRSYQDLQACDEHHPRTCCERNDTARIRLSWAAFASERSPRCAKLAQLAFCALCDADVGTGAKSSANAVRLCPSFCARWFEACSEDFFAPSASGGGIAPCGPEALVCSPLAEITQDAASFCSRVEAPLGNSFEVAESEEHAEDELDGGCFDGVPAAKWRGAAQKAPWTRVTRTSWQGPWWRRTLPPGLLRAFDAMRFQLAASGLEKYAPQVLLAFVAIFFTYFLWSRRDSDNDVSEEKDESEEKD